ncbi:MAG: hypothetical protein ACR2P1_06105 [Pseudomonadales bacterium]
MSAFLQYPDLNIEIICNNGHTKVRDLCTGEERDMATSTAGFDRPNNNEKEVARQPAAQEKT